MCPLGPLQRRDRLRDYLKLHYTHAYRSVIRPHLVHWVCRIGGKWSIFLRPHPLRRRQPGIRQGRARIAGTGYRLTLAEQKTGTHTYT